MENPDISDLIFSKSELNTLSAQCYEILRKVGEGSFAKVFLCKKTIDGEVSYSACKTIDTKKAPKDFVKKFLPREIEILLKIKHQYIIHVEFIFQRRSKYYILMRFAENRDLLEYILANPNEMIPEKRCRTWMTQIFLALKYLHVDENIVHRDIKCENILLTKNFNVRLCDFGFSKRMKKDEVSRTFCGSRAYTAPEVLRGKPYNAKMYDIWSSGIVLMVMLNKKFPFNETTNRKLIQKMAEKHMSWRPKVQESISEELKTAAMKILEADPKKRWDIMDCLQSEWITMEDRVMEESTMEPLERKKEKSFDKLMKVAKTNAEAEISQMTILRAPDNTIQYKSIIVGASEIQGYPDQPRDKGVHTEVTKVDSTRSINVEDDDQINEYRPSTEETASRRTSNPISNN